MVQGPPHGPPGGQYPPGGYPPPPAPPGGQYPPGHYPPPGPHGFAPPKAALPASKPKGKGGAILIVIGALGAIVVLSAFAAVAVSAVQRYKEKAEQVTKKSQVTQQLPDWCPVFPNGQVINSQLVDTGEGPTDGTVTIVAAEPLANVLSFYRTAPKRKGFTITALTSSPEQFIIEAKSQDGARKMVTTGTKSGAAAQVVVLLSTRHTDRAAPHPGDELPAYLPTMPGAQVTQQVTRSSGAEPHGFVKFEINQPLAAILDFYEQSLKLAGKNPTRERNLVFVPSAKSPDERLVQVVVVGEQGVKQVSLIVSEPK